VLDVLSSTTPRPSGRKRRWARHLAALATKAGEKCGLAGAERVRPWPWADAWPVARLILPGGEDHIVLAGANGRNLAFAPGHLDGSAPPGGDGACVIAGHRDTHFAVLENLAPGDRVVLEDVEGTLHSYRVTAAAVVDEHDTQAIPNGGRQTLVLVTCWPFDSPVAGGPLRYVVWAEAEGQGSKTS